MDIFSKHVSGLLAEGKSLEDAVDAFGFAN